MNGNPYQLEEDNRWWFLFRFLFGPRETATGFFFQFQLNWELILLFTLLFVRIEAFWANKFKRARPKSIIYLFSFQFCVRGIFVITYLPMRSNQCWGWALCFGAPACNSMFGHYWASTCHRAHLNLILNMWIRDVFFFENE